jgi:hypothetical protein
MHPARLTILSLLLLSGLFAEDAALQRRKDEANAAADRIFGQRYLPVAGKPMRLYDKQTGTGPPDAIIFWHGSNYVIELVFAADGRVARIILQPEPLLYSDNWTDVPDTVELSPAEMQWLVASANILRPLGNVRAMNDAPNGCFQSGKNLYCSDQYELAVVSHYHMEKMNDRQLPQIALENIAIVYEQLIVGVVEQTRVKGSQRHLRVGGQWYHGEKPGVEIFDKAQIGSVVHLITYGCTANEKACVAVPEENTIKSVPLSGSPF